MQLYDVHRTGHVYEESCYDYVLTMLRLCETICILVDILVAILDLKKNLTLKLIYNPHN